MKDAIERLPRGYEVGSYQREGQDGRCVTLWRWRLVDGLWVEKYVASGRDQGPLNEYDVFDAGTAACCAWDNALGVWLVHALALGLYHWARRGDQSDARIGAAKDGRACAVIDLWTTGTFALGGPQAERGPLVERLQRAGMIRGVSRTLTAGEWDLPPRTG